MRDKEMKGCATEKRKGRNIVREGRTGDEMKEERRERAGQKGEKGGEEESRYVGGVSGSAFRCHHIMSTIGGINRWIGFTLRA